MSDQKDDSILHQLDDIIEPVADKFELQEDAALLVLGSKIVIDEKDHDEDAVHTYIMMVGYYEVLMEGLYSEIKGQIDKGNFALFNCFRTIVRSIEEDLGIDPDEEIDDGQEETVLH